MPDDRVKRPSYAWYPGDFKRDTAVQSCSFLVRAVWRDMLDLMHDGEPYGHLTAGGQPITPEEFARMNGLQTRAVREAFAELERKAVFSRTEAGVIYSRRMVRDEATRASRAAGGSRSLDNPNVPRPKTEEDAAKDGGKDTQKDTTEDGPSLARVRACRAADANAEEDPRFLAFWNAYPKHDAKKAARVAFRRLKVTDALLEIMLAAIASQRCSEQWRKDRGQFIPHASTWLNQARWDDDLAIDGELARKVGPDYSRPWYDDCHHQPPCANLPEHQLRKAKEAA